MTLRILAVILIVAFNSSVTASAQNTSPPTESPQANQPDATPASADHPSELSAEHKEQKRQLEIGMILVGGILILGVFLLVVTLLVSRRVKRTAATGRQPSQPRDELWYLKNPPDRSAPETREGSE